MAKSAFIGIENIARKIKKVHIGVDGVARKVKKAWIGVNGVARLFYSSQGVLSRYGTIDPRSIDASPCAAASIGDYALFAGGGVLTKTVDAYDKSLTHTTPTALSFGAERLSATTVGNHALFGGGYGKNSSNEYIYLTTVNAYDKSLTRTIPTALSVGMDNVAATTVGGYALFGGGHNGSMYNATVNAYDKSLTRTIPTALSVARSNLAATSVGGYALFGGGANADATARNTVDAYDKSLTRTTPAVLSVARRLLAAANTESHALFAGGTTYHGYNTDAVKYATVDAYDQSLTRTTATALPEKKYWVCGCSLNGYAVFAAGANYLTSSNLQGYSSVTAYDESLTQTTPEPLSAINYLMSAASVGDYMLFGGGSLKNVTEVYQVK